MARQTGERFQSDKEVQDRARPAVGNRWQQVETVLGKPTALSQMGRSCLDENPPQHLVPPQPRLSQLS